MQIDKRYPSFIFCFLLLLVIGYNARCQTIEPCYDGYLAISKEYNAGNFAAMDSLFTVYKNSDCFKRNKAANINVTIAIYQIIIKQRLRDGFRKNEADSLQFVLNSLEKHTSWQRQTSNYRDTSYSQWRVGPSAGLNFSALGAVGSSEGFMLGWRSQNFHRGGWGIDAGAYYQNMPFLFNVIRANSIDPYSVANGARLSGFAFKASGKVSFYDFPVVLSYNLKEAEVGGFGLELTAGAELLKTHTTYIASSYHQYQYASKHTNFSDEGDTSTTAIIGDSSLTKTNYRSSSFFKNQRYINLTLGFNVYWHITDHFLISFSPEYSQNVSGRFALSEVNYSQPNDSFILRVTCSYLFKKAKRKVKGGD